MSRWRGVPPNGARSMTRDPGRRPQRIGERAGQGEADGTAAGNDDVVTLLHPAACVLHRAASDLA